MLRSLTNNTILFVKLLGVFIGIYWMLLGSVITGFIAYYLNAFYSGRFIDYSIGEQIKDIMPSFTVASFMAIVVYGMSYINLPISLLLVAQIITGFVITYIICEIFKLDSYLEIKEIALAYLNKIKHEK